MDTDKFDFAGFLDAITLDVLPDGWLKTLRDVIDYQTAQQRAAAVAMADKDPTIPADGKLVGDAVDVSGDFLNCVFDQRHMMRRPKRKWYTTDTKIGDRTGSSRLTYKRGLCFHHTAVKGGFGADRAMIDEYAELLRDRDMAEVMEEMFFKSSRVLKADEAARALALAARYRGEPPRQFNMGVSYHALMGPNSVLYLNLPFELVSWHGNGANNDFLGVGWDALSGADHPDADDLIADVGTIIQIARDSKHDIREFTTHSVYTNKPTDPDAEFINSVMIPAAKEYGCTIDYDFKSNKAGARSIRETLDAA